MSSITNRRNILQLMRDRELNDHIRTKYALKSNLNYKCISKLGLLAQLEGHQGCVNCLQWNESGSTLASASDDYQVILWDPFLQKVKTTIKTLHRGNIFSVKFIPSCNDDIVATGAGDWSSHTYNVTTGQQLSNCICSQGRIKRLAVANDTPSVYWSASEDGCISQHDMRMNHECPNDKSKITLVSVYGSSGKKIEAKCLDINQLKTEQLAVGANDQYVRLYDRRMIRSLSSFTVKYTNPSNSSDFILVCTDGNATEALNKLQSTLQYFVPGHIHTYNNEVLPKKQKSYVITYLTFSPDGQELLVNYGGEYVYLYNLLDQADNAFFNIPKVMKAPRENGEGSSLDLIDEPVPVPHLTLPDKVEQLKLKANYLFEKEDYTAAIILYNEAIDIHKCSVLFSNRAAAYIKRKWHGDYYAALKDCITALELEPNHMKAHFRLAVCLYELGKLKDSKKYLDQFTVKYPSYKTSAAYKCLQSDLLKVETSNKERIAKQKMHDAAGSAVNYVEVIQVEQTQKKTFEKYFSSRSKDYHRRYYGHCNTSTDIKEANFFGNQNQFIVAGSDDGLFFVWEKNTENNLLILKGDSSIVNCVQPHPSEFMLATSGIDNEVKLWSPLSDDVDNMFIIEDYNGTATINQRRMMADPFEVILRNMRRTTSDGPETIDLDAIRDQFGIDPLSDDFNDCRMS
ncbi:WD and tetratricopeptide repeats protein 1-like [Melanaphis sacchari]|uniref:WD and tetratricopeptide repeats protein 1 n=1 Tax=Melanaphis sacchari TaxID=742174 RepID=A0A2H8THQ4_9HEMI|nr:WD and tetratricopeptide repeats protein 1-like [Melanaphis sacchari]XP_025190601.1 WD and tetratricopeptide repeats protein 1-like [Melanaphis sacchari]XP_025190602.1 WD and tetratricopeptide repeats protein 1-like [Melanaphis sacchari]